MRARIICDLGNDLGVVISARRIPAQVESLKKTAGTVTVTENSMSISIPCPEGTRFLVWYPDEQTAQDVHDAAVKATYAGIATDLLQFGDLTAGNTLVVQRSKIANGTVSANVSNYEEAMAAPFVFTVPSASTPPYILPGTYLWEAYG